MNVGFLASAVIEGASPHRSAMVFSGATACILTTFIWRRWAILGLAGEEPSEEPPARRATQRLFRLVGLLSRILPVKVRMDSFDPAYNDEKKQYLEDKRRYQSKCARRWLAFCFGFHVAWMVGQCVWCMCSEKVKRLLLNVLPESFRKFLGG